MTGATNLSEAAQPDTPGVVRSSEGLGVEPERVTPCGVVLALSIVGTPMPNSSGVEWLRPVERGTRLYDQIALDAAAAAARERCIGIVSDAQVYREREDLAMMIRMLTSSLKRHTPHAPQPGDLPSRAMELLRKYGLMGSPLREHTEQDDGPPQVA